MDKRDRLDELLALADAKSQRGEISRREFLKWTTVLGAGLAAPGLVAACGTEEAAAPAGDQTLRFLVAEQFEPGWHPYARLLLIGLKIRRNVFDRLVEVQADLSRVPGLAESWEQIDDRTWEFKLRPDVTFHNGQPFTAEDVKASIELVSGTTGEELAHTSLWVPHEGIVVDDLTVRLRGKQPFGALLNTLAVTDILAKADVEKGEKHLEKNPNGTGAFRVASETPAKKTLERFPKHYRGEAKLKTVVWEFIQDSQTRINALLGGQAHVIDRVEPDQIRLLEGRGGVNVVSATGVEIQSLWFRQDKKPFADNPALRRAVAWGIDRQAIVDLIGGETKLADTHLAPGIEFRQPQEPSYTFDPERSEAEMKAAGVSPPVSFEIGSPVGFYAKNKELTELIAENLGRVGFNVKTTFLDTPAWIDWLFGENKPGHASTGGWAGPDIDPDFAVAFLLRSPGGWTGAHDKQTDALIDKGKVTVDEDERAKVYADLQARLWREAPSVPLIYSDLTNGLSDKVTGFELFPTFVHDFWPVALSA